MVFRLIFELDMTGKATVKKINQKKTQRSRRSSTWKELHRGANNHSVLAFLNAI